MTDRRTRAAVSPTHAHWRACSQNDCADTVRLSDTNIWFQGLAQTFTSADGRRVNDYNLSPDPSNRNEPPIVSNYHDKQVYNESAERGCRRICCPSKGNTHGPRLERCSGRNMAFV